MNHATWIASCDSVCLASSGQAAAAFSSTTQSRAAANERECSTGLTSPRTAAWRSGEWNAGGNIDVLL